MDYYPKRIICLTEETTETLYLLGAQDRIVGISGFTVRPKIARKEKPKVSLFTDANIEDILILEPDLVIGFSDIQANIAKELIERGITVWVNNYRTIDGVFKMIVQLGALVGKLDQAVKLVNSYKHRILEIEKIVSKWNIKPRVYFEEWFDPLISGIAWVGELIDIAGGEDILKDNRHSLAKDRIIKNPNLIVYLNPDIIIGSWCGKAFKSKKVKERIGWQKINAVKNNQLFEINSSIILQPGPAALTEGLERLLAIFLAWNELELR